MTTPDITQKSPPWGGNVKLVVGFTMVAIMAAFLINFQNLISPLLLTFILTYLLHPVVSRLSKSMKMSWRMAVNVVFLVLVVGVGISFTATGFALVQQLESLIQVVDSFINRLPEMVLEWSTSVYQIGPFQLDISQYLTNVDLEALIQQFISVVQPALGQAGGVLATVATGMVSILGWGFFVILISYFLLADMHKVPGDLVVIDLPEYDADIRRMGKELSRIWNAFLRGQVILFSLTVFIYSVLLVILDVRYVLGLAILAGFARFVPYLGQWVTWAVLIIVTLFQESNHFGLEPIQYLILVFVVALVVDNILDSVVAPRILGQTLGVHPAAVFVAALIALNILGLLGVILAAPVLASFILIGRYVARKMLDLDPWPPTHDDSAQDQYPWSNLVSRLREWLGSIFSKLRDWIGGYRPK
jgi:predicted PurR-regulated permease PerM